VKSYKIYSLFSKKVCQGTKRELLEALDKWRFGNEYFAHEGSTTYFKLESFKQEIESLND
jgi:hypothetical protein